MKTTTTTLVPLPLVPSSLDLDGLLRRLHLPTVRRLYPELQERAEADGLAYRDYLALLAAEEVAHRTQTRIQRATRHAGFPFLRTIEEFDFTFQTSVRLGLLGTYLGPELVTEGRSLILAGKPGTGKTHLAVAIAYRAIQNGYDARFTTAADLLDRLALASRQGRLADALTAYTHPHVLVIDEVGYLSYDSQAVDLLYKVVDRRHERPGAKEPVSRSILITTNLAFRDWNTVFPNATSIATLLDKLVHHADVTLIAGESYRVHESQQEAAARRKRKRS